MTEHVDISELIVNLFFTIFLVVAVFLIFKTLSSMLIYYTYRILTKHFNYKFIYGIRGAALKDKDGELSVVTYDFTYTSLAKYDNLEELKFNVMTKESKEDFVILNIQCRYIGFYRLKDEE